MAIRHKAQARQNKADMHERIQSAMDALDTEEELMQTFTSSSADSDHAVQFEEFFGDDEEAEEFVDEEFGEDDFEIEEEEELLEASDGSDEELVNEEEDEEWSDNEIEAYLKQVSLKDDGKKGTPFEQVMPKKKPRTGIKIQHKQRKIHNLLTIRELVELTPSVCKFEHCMYDAADKAGFIDWAHTPKSKQKLVLRILQKHVKEEHKHVNHSIIDKADVQSFWLSSNMI